jgi:hypothetical protein
MIKDEKMPTRNTTSFHLLSHTLKVKLMIFLAARVRFIESCFPGAFLDAVCNQTFSEKMNVDLGVSRSKSQFEYVDTILSCNIPLHEHID